MELKQSLRMSQTLVMTPQLQQAIKLLQLSRMELLETVREEMETNPLLEEPDETADGNIDERAPGEASLEAANAEGPTTEALEAKVPERAEEVKGEGAPEIDWDAYFNSYQFNEPTTASNKNNVATEDLPSFEANLVEREDLSRHLEAQLGFLKLNDAERRVAALILGNLDDDGYLKLQDVEGDPLIRLASEGDVSVVLAERTLRKIHQLEPKGCGARDLQECLLIQA
ncbi:MAG TPA: RNA polymerase sigma-54 factor, partial [Myxococcaceae bacterium]|nr:RNA polymerase sigma-54 factor [Myxococcaceae bacterium]